MDTIYANNDSSRIEENDTQKKETKEAKIGQELADFLEDVIKHGSEKPM